MCGKGFNPVVLRSQPKHRIKPLSIRPLLLVNLSLLALLWLLLFIRIHTEWIVNDLYAYGWAVPFLAAYLFAERWRDRPAPAADRPPDLLALAPTLLLLLYLPLRVINEANPDWVKVNVYLTCLTAGFSLSALYAMGRLRYVWHFAFPIFFVFTALPWPVQIEENIVQTLTRWNTLVSADTLTLCGIPATTVNLIQIGETLGQRRRGLQRYPLPSDIVHDVPLPRRIYRLKVLFGFYRVSLLT
ncbi:MAG: archaeosortase/exosortase family protein, partial [Nibricoccus sp.]